MQEQDSNMTEIANAIFSDLLTENPDQAVSAFGPHRVVPDRWKGMSPQQLEDIRQQQDKQRLEKEVSVFGLKINNHIILLLFTVDSYLK